LNNYLLKANRMLIVFSMFVGRKNKHKIWV
jgi:hypothetical protein